MPQLACKSKTYGDFGSLCYVFHAVVILVLEFQLYLNFAQHTVYLKTSRSSRLDCSFPIEKQYINALILLSFPLPSTYNLHSNFLKGFFL